MHAQETFSHIACTLALVGLLAGALPAEAQQSGSSSQKTTPSQSPTVSQNLPDSPGAVRSSAQEQRTPDNSAALLAQSQNAPGNAGQSESAPPQKPVGTAAAEAPNVSAIAASQPAGVAIAPAKQHRVRTIVIRTGAIIGAGVAIGAVVALTAATPPKPPGAH